MRSSPYLLASLILAGTTAVAASPDFESRVAPILKARCLECHNANDRSGGLDLATAEGLAKGGENGPVVDRDELRDSLILKKVQAGEMPPAKSGKPRKLSSSEIETIRSWVDSGAAWPKGRVLDPFENSTDTRAGRDWWSLRPPRRAEIPPGANPIDHLARAALAAKGWTQAPPADRRVLIRRVYQDVIGLPPSLEEIEKFVADPRPDAYERLVDELLASPRFGERWARLWLDVARFAETSGYERDQVKPFAWKYRDWVVRSINEDKPYDRFVLEQLAGDELPDRTEQTVVATGFLRLGTWNDEPNDPNEYQYDRLEDMIGATSTAFQAMTVRCARCHDHKFDPVRQTDYYRMGAAFWAGYIPSGPRDWLGGPPPDALGKEVLGWTDRGREVPDLRVLKKGDPNRPAQVAAPGFLSMLPELDAAFESPSPSAKTTGRRLQLARRIVDRRNPLTARVWVNRIWAGHFGQGIVRSVDNFGFNGDKPTHPELLDDLAVRLMDGGWKSKPIHRLILLSDTYRQSSIHPKQAEYAASDAGNRLLWRFDRRRLDAESIHDALLAAAGRLDLSRMGGPSFHPEIPPDALEGLSTKEKAWTASPPAERLRRGLYAFSKRGLLTPFLTVFDFPDTTLPCGKRDVTLVPPQALALLNNGFVHEQSRALAAKLVSADRDRDARIRAAWRAILKRDPNGDEIEAARKHLARLDGRFPAAESDLHATASLCHVLMNSNEFLYVD